VYRGGNVHHVHQVHRLVGALVTPRPSARQSGSRSSLDRQNVTNIPRLAFRAEEAPLVLGVSADHFRRHVMPDLPVVRSGGVRLYAVADAAEWLAERSSLSHSPRGSGTRGGSQSRSQSGAARASEGRMKSGESR
jgi:hypothetical protein